MGKEGDTKRTISVYIDDGRVFSYDVDNAGKAREHIDAIVKHGYRHNDGEVFEHYGSHRILKVATKNIPTKYTDEVTGT